MEWTDNTSVPFALAQNTEQQPVPEAPRSDGGIENAVPISLMVGGGFSSLNWFADNQVKKGDEGVITYAKARYDLSSALAPVVQFEGRVYDFHISASYLNQDLKELDTSGTEIFNLVVGHKNFLGSGSDLRLGFEQAEIRGAAHYSDTGQAPFSDVVDSKTAFTAFYRRLWMDVSPNRRIYVGATFGTYRTPSAIGFSNELGQLQFTAFDSGLELTEWAVHAAYEQREYLDPDRTSYTGLFSSGRVEVGKAYLDVSAPIRREAISRTGKKGISTPEADFGRASGEFGLAHVRRSSALRGAGFIITGGLRASLTNYKASQSKNPHDDASVLYVEFDRTDFVLSAFATLLIGF